MDIDNNCSISFNPIAQPSRNVPAKYSQKRGRDINRIFIKLESNFI